MLGHLREEWLILQYQTKLYRKGHNDNYWWSGVSGKQWHEYHYRKAKENKKYLTEREPMTVKISEQFKFNKFDLLIEIGCGHGTYIDFLSKHNDCARNLTKYIGMDISEETIEFCKETYPQSKVEFIAGKIDAYLEERSFQSACILSWGCIEYFTEEELKSTIINIQSKIKKGFFILHERSLTNIAELEHSVP